MFRDQLQIFIAQALAEKSGSVPFSVSASEYHEHGDYATNAAMRYKGKPPREIAEELALALGQEKIIERAESAGPGFVNIRLKDSFLAGELKKALDNPGSWGRSNQGERKKVIVEYFQLNIAKRPHVGHLRSAVIGDAIKRMLVSQDYDVVSDTHVGDWGTQFGILIYAYKNTTKENQLSIDELLEADPYRALEELEKIYIKETGKKLSLKKFPDNLDVYTPAHANEEGKKEFSKLEKGDKDNRKIWEKIRSASIKVLEQSADDLGLEKFDLDKGESFYEDKMDLIVDVALQKGDEIGAVKTEDGAVIINLEAEGLDQAVLKKSDGASTYLLRDLATIRWRKEQWNFWRNLYVVDVRQSHHFRQVFRVAELLGFEGVGESQHIEFGSMSLPEGLISTRKGIGFSLKTLVEVAKRQASDAIKQKNPELKEKEAVAKKVGLGAVKYFDLSHHRRSDIVFRWDSALSFEGNTGPYLQYTYARLKSILRKVGETGGSLEIITLDELEHRLLLKILQLPESIEDALKDYAPNHLAQYLFELAKLSNEFYHSHPVMQEEDRERQSLRILLVQGAALSLKNGLNLLGIEAPEEM